MHDVMVLLKKPARRFTSSARSLFLTGLGFVLLIGFFEQELFKMLPEKLQEDFKARYGRPDQDDSECELYYLTAKSSSPRPCVKCPVWCNDPAKKFIYLNRGEIYYIGKTCRKRGIRAKEHLPNLEFLDLQYVWINRGTEGYITTQEQLHLKTYYLRNEALKENCRLYLPPGNSIGISKADWRLLQSQTY